jgi:hypothetical protein
VDVSGQVELFAVDCRPSHQSNNDEVKTRKCGTVFFFSFFGCVPLLFSIPFLLPVVHGLLSTEWTKEKQKQPTLFYPRIRPRCQALPALRRDPRAPFAVGL